MKVLLYMIFVLMLGSPAVLLSVGLILLQSNILLCMVLLLACIIYHGYVWMPLRLKFNDIDNECMKLLGWNT